MVNSFVKSRCDAIKIIVDPYFIMSNVMSLSLFACELFLARGSVVMYEYVVSREIRPDSFHKK